MSKPILTFFVAIGLFSWHSGDSRAQFEKELQSESGNQRSMNEESFEPHYTTALIEFASEDGTDSIAGELIQLDGRYVTIKNRLFRSPLSLSLNSVRAIQWFHSSPEQNRSSRVELNLVDGSRLIGVVLSDLDSEPKIQFEEDLLGKIEIDKSKIVASTGNRWTVYEWDGNLSSWKSPNVADPLHWEVSPTGSLKPNAKNADAWLSLRTRLESAEKRANPLPFELELRISGAHSPEILIAFGDVPEKSVRIESVGNSLILGSAEDFEVIYDFPHDKWDLDLRLVWDPINHSVRCTDNESRTFVCRTGQSELISGVLLKSKNGDFEINKLKVMKLDNTIDEVKSIGKASKVSTENGDLSDAKSLDLLRGDHGTLLRGKCIRVGEDTLQWNCDILNSKPILIPIQKCSRMELANPRAVLKSPFSLALGSLKVRGNLEFESEQSLLTWKCTGQSSAVPINTTFPFLLTRTDRVRELDYQLYPDLIYTLRDECIPCRVGELLDEEIRLQTPWGQSTISTKTVQAIELNRNGTPLQSSFTKESLEQLLSLPRGSEEMTFTNAILGENGDLLRCSIVRLTESFLEAEYKFNPIVIQRDSIAGIVFLRPSKHEEKSGHQAEDEVENRLASDLNRIGEDAVETDKKELSWIRIHFYNKYSILVQFIRLEAQSLICQSEVFGKVSIPIQSISSIAGYGYRSLEKPPYSNWIMKQLPGPNFRESESNSVEADSLIGTLIDPFELPSLKGGTINSTDFLGKVIILDFWATWCGPCQKLLPEYLEVISQMEHREVTFLGVNNSENPDAVRKFLSEKKWPEFETLFDYDSSLANRFHVSGIPHTVVISPTGRVAYVSVGYTEKAAINLKREIENLLIKD